MSRLDPRLVRERLERVRALSRPLTDQEARDRMEPRPGPVPLTAEVVSRRLETLRALDRRRRHLQGAIKSRSG